MTLYELIFYVVLTLAITIVSVFIIVAYTLSQREDED